MRYRRCVWQQKFLTNTKQKMRINFKSNIKSRTQSLKRALNKLVLELENKYANFKWTTRTSGCMSRLRIYKRILLLKASSSPSITVKRIKHLWIAKCTGGLHARQSGSLCAYSTDWVWVTISQKTRSKKNASALIWSQSRITPSPAR